MTTLNKVNIKGVEYGLGEAKLVATAQWESDSFKTGRILMEDKLYLIDLVDHIYGYRYSVITLYHNEHTESNVIFMADKDDMGAYPFIVNIYNHSNNTYISFFPLQEGIEETIFSNGNCEANIYELPITFGGNK